MTSYSNFFYKSVSSRSELVSYKVLSHLFESAINIKSIKDVGCGEGEWLNSNILGYGKYDLHGYDLPEAIELAKNNAKNEIALYPIDFELIEENVFANTDLTIFTEVAEHLTEDCAKQIIDFICKTSKIVIFSGAIPGQGGFNHVNEQPLNYWVRLFEMHNFIPIDYIRPKLIGDKSIPFFYRNNLFLFIKNNKEIIVNNFYNFNDLNKQIVSSDNYLKDYRNFWQKSRYRLIKIFSYRFVNLIYRLVDLIRISRRIL